MNFYVGQKVVCIKESPWSGGYGDEICPKRGAIYTIRGKVEYLGILGLLLCEIRNHSRAYSVGIVEPPFYVARFRPVVNRKTDISIFRKMLTDNRVSV